MEANYIQHMGSDLTVVNAARVSFNKESGWEEEWGLNGPVFESKFEVIGNRLSEKDQKLISYLAKHNHWTPFSHVQITMREKVPIFVARQRFKHVVGFAYNEVSRRYVDDPPEFFTPTVWRSKPENVKQGSGDKEITHIQWQMDVTSTKNKYDIKVEYESILDQVQWLYTRMIEAGVAPEQARMVLPQSLYTEYYCTGSLAAWARAYKLRIDPHAQKEIQDLAIMWDKVISEIKELEHSWKALTR